MEPRAKEWMLATARGDYHAIARLLREEPRLARRRVRTPQIFIIIFIISYFVFVMRLLRCILSKLSLFLLTSYTEKRNRSVFLI